jgi:hypothetical protein
MNTRRSFSIFVATASAALAVAACSAAPTTSPGTDGTDESKAAAAPSSPAQSFDARKRPPLLPPAEGLVSATRVELHKDGTETVTTTWHSPDEMARHVALRTKLQDAKRSGAPIVTDTVQDPVGCAYDDVELWDGRYATGATICFVGEGSVDLKDYARNAIGGYWDGAVKSYWPAAGDGPYNDCDGEDGYLAGYVPLGGPCQEHFSACARSYVNAGACGQIAFKLVLTD